MLYSLELFDRGNQGLKANKASTKLSNTTYQRLSDQSRAKMDCHENNISMTKRSVFLTAETPFNLLLKVNNERLWY